MRLVSFAPVFVLCVGAGLALGCGRDRAESPADRVAMLQSPDVGERRDAADGLMEDDGPPPQAVPHLIAALQREQDPRTYSVLLLALGKSGAPEARPYLEANLSNQNRTVRDRAQKALELWARRNPNGVMGGPPPQPGLLPPPPPPGEALPPPPAPPPPPPGPPEKTI
jgi:hypothetical protein